MRYDDETVRKTLETSREILSKEFRVSEPDLTRKEWQLPEPEEPAPERRRDTNPNNAQTQQQVEWLTQKLADVLPAIDTILVNINKEWGLLKSRAETAEKQLEELQKRFNDLQRSVALDIRGVELSWQSDLLQLRQERYIKEPTHGSS